LNSKSIIPREVGNLTAKGFRVVCVDALAIDVGRAAALPAQSVDLKDGIPC
jgi:hypothetical protein